MSTLKFIADVGGNHNKSKERVVYLIQAAKWAGFDAVKFQLYEADKLYAPEFPELREAARKGELPIEFVPFIAEWCKKEGIEFHCTPFDIPSVYLLRPWVNEFKIASYSVAHTELIDACLNQGLPVSISLGCATEEERTRIQNIVAGHGGTDVCLYYCVPKYPAALDKIVMPFFSSNVFLRGYSDHTRQPAAIFAAVANGADRIEMHFDLDNMNGIESHNGHCWPTVMAAEVVRAARQMRSILQNRDSEPSCEEVRKWRNDPEDGMRPMKMYREELREKSQQ